MIQRAQQTPRKTCERNRMNFRLDDTDDDEPQAKTRKVALWSSLAAGGCRQERMQFHCNNGKANLIGWMCVEGLKKSSVDFAHSFPTLVRRPGATLQVEVWEVTKEVFDSIAKMEKDAGYTLQWLDLQDSCHGHNREKCALWVRFHLDPVSQLVQRFLQT